MAGSGRWSALVRQRECPFHVPRESKSAWPASESKPSAPLLSWLTPANLSGGKRRVIVKAAPMQNRTALAELGL